MYYPQSQVTTNLYTNGGEFQIKSTKQPYVGYYFTTSTGISYTGRNQNDTPVLELESLVIIKGNIEQNIKVETIDIPIYNSLKPIESNLIFKPVYNPNVPTQQDYQIGEYRRYFCKKTNEVIYIEINKDTFDKLVSQSDDIQWTLYQPFDIPWNIVGNKEQVAKINRNIVLLTMKNLSLPAFDRYLKFDFTKYLKEN
jgi:hypothetical protein